MDVVGRRFRGWLLLMGGLAMLLVACQVAGPASAPGASSSVGAPSATLSGLPRPGRPAPDFTLSKLGGGTQSLADFRGKTVLLNFWATWCGPCRTEMPELQGLYRELKGRGLEVVGIDIQEDEATVGAFVQEGHFDWTFLLDPDGKVTGTYLITGVPTTFFIDRDGVIRDLHVGPLTRQAATEKIQQLLRD